MRAFFCSQKLSIRIRIQERLTRIVSVYTCDSYKQIGVLCLCIGINFIFLFIVQISKKFNVYVFGLHFFKGGFKGMII